MSDDMNKIDRVKEIDHNISSRNGLVPNSNVKLIPQKPNIKRGKLTKQKVP